MHALLLEVISLHIPWVPPAHHRVCSCGACCLRRGSRHHRPLPADCRLALETRPPRGQDFVPQPDGTLRCPAGQTLRPTEQRRERDGTLRVLYAAKIRDCRGCQLREQCQWHWRATQKPRRVSLLWHPRDVGSAPVRWKDWSRRQHRRAAMQLLRHQRVEVHVEQAHASSPDNAPSSLSRAQRAHYRLSFQERLARNTRAPTAGQVTIRLFGVPEAFATFLDLPTA